MSARNPPKPGWVTVAAAAAALTKAGDTIDASNVSRYLHRNDDVPSEKHGKFRWVDLQALMAHRNTSLFVSDKRDARDLEPVATTMPVSSVSDLDDDDDLVGAGGGSELKQTVLALKQIELRRKLRDEQVEHGELVPAGDVQTVLTAALEAYAAELSRQEARLTAKFGREVGTAVRTAHGTARAAAVARMIAAAKETLEPSVPVEPAVDEAAVA